MIAQCHNRMSHPCLGIKEYRWNTERSKYPHRCLAFGIKPIEPKQGVPQNIEYNEWEHKQCGTSWKEKIRLEIDELILKVKNVDELLAELELLGYTIRRGKYISVKAPEQQKAVRLKNFWRGLHGRKPCFEDFVERCRGGTEQSVREVGTP